ncbi:MAG: 50S ribosomal protein L35 [Candidatus Omnitrophica bacterium]|nr:50S ribosomal protein L35 [Candidatus Omnitrophota bacterium]
MGKRIKLKTNKAARKRFKVTATGKVLHMKPFRRHLLSGRNSSRKRRLRKGSLSNRVSARVIKALLAS